MAELIRLHDLTLGYDRQPAVHHLSGAFAEGSLTAVIGPNGAGKSTLLKGIMGLLRPLTGRVEFCGGLTRPEMGWLPQQAATDRSFPITVADTVLLGHWHRIGAFRSAEPALAQRVSEALALVGLGGLERRSVGALSAGQFQRLLFARLVVQEARLILLDEPFSAIDAATTADLLRLVRRWHQEGRTVIAVLHDFEQVRQHFPTALLLAREALGWGPTAEVLTPARLAAARQRAEGWSTREQGWCPVAA